MRRIILAVLLLGVVVSFASFVFAKDEIIARIDIRGNKIVSNATVISKIKIRPTQAYNENVVNEDIKNLYASGFFETVEVDKETTPEGIVVIFKLKEKPVLKKLDIEGAHFIRGKKILESIDIKEGSFVDDYKLKETIRKIKDLYTKKGFTQADIDYDLRISKDTNEATVKIVIDEKRVVKVREVFVEGNDSIRTKRIIKLMKTRRAWLFNRAIFKREVLRDDVRRVSDYYKTQGFSDVTVDADVDYEPKGVYVTIKIIEGKRYYIGQIDVEGNNLFTEEEIKKTMHSKVGDAFSEQAIYQDASNIRQIYVDDGYIFSQVKPFSFYNPETEKVDVTYKITESEVAYVEKIDIKGNIKTKDKVIRRELRIYPGDRFDGKKVRKSKERLENLGFFEEIRFGTDPGTEQDQVDLIVDVKEAKTGYISFGGGYSSIDEFIGFVELRQRNFDYKNFATFTGAGQDLSLTASFGTLTQQYKISFANPWIFDMPLTFGFDAYQKGHKREEDVGYAYKQEIRGGDLFFSKEFNDYLSGRIAYRLERVEISDVVDDATQELKDEAGSNTLSSVELGLGFDKRDNVFSPSKGIYFINNFQTTGGPFGGDKDFFKYYNRFSVYFPLIRKSVLELRLRTGFADPFSDTEKVPIYERFFAGGASTIRGYRERRVGPIDALTDDPIGGEAMFIGNIEYTYPLVDFLKVATFFDTGNVWKKNTDFMSGDLKSSIGLGLRIKTPIGPVNVDYGWPLDAEPGTDKKEGRFHFSVSRGF